ncbi:MAG: hypothetical protein V4649_05250 [Bacteroidota bacterium]
MENGLAYAGNLNVCLSFAATFDTFIVLEREIAIRFTPQEILYDSFDVLNNQDCYDRWAPVEKEHIVYRVVFRKGKEAVFLLYCSGRLIFENSFRANVAVVAEGWKLIQHYCGQYSDWQIVIGFELSISPHDYELSVVANAGDKSLHPIVVVNGNKGIIEKMVYADTGLLVHPMYKVIKQYLAKLGIA